MLFLFPFNFLDDLYLYFKNKLYKIKKGGYYTALVLRVLPVKLTTIFPFTSATSRDTTF